MNDANATPSVKIQLQKIYVKELTYKVPYAPGIFINPDAKEQLAEPVFSFELDVKHHRLSLNQYEIVLHVIVATKTKNNTTSFTMDIHQSGIFLLEGFNDDQLPAIFNNLCVPQLYPYLCRSITDASIQAGFPPIILSPLQLKAGEDQASNASSRKDEVIASVESAQPVSQH